MREDFDGDSTKPNPYEEPRVRESNIVSIIELQLTPRIDVTLGKLKRVLALEEVAQFSDGRKPPHEVTPSGFLRMAIDIEERQ